MRFAGVINTSAKREDACQNTGGYQYDVGKIPSKSVREIGLLLVRSHSRSETSSGAARVSMRVSEALSAQSVCASQR